MEVDGGRAAAVGEMEWCDPVEMEDGSGSLLLWMKMASSLVGVPPVCRWLVEMEM